MLTLDVPTLTATLVLTLVANMVVQQRYRANAEAR